MRATKEKSLATKKFSMLKTGLNQLEVHIPNAAFWGLILLMTASIACAPPSNDANRQNDSTSSAPNDIPEITDEIMRREINDVYLTEVPEETGTGETISWRVNEAEPKEFTVVEKNLKGNRATIVLDIKTGTAPKAPSPKSLAGQIRTKWELQTGWAMRTWEIVETENISLKYKNLPKTPAQNSKR